MQIRLEWLIRPKIKFRSEVLPVERFSFDFLSVEVVFEHFPHYLRVIFAATGCITAKYLPTSVATCGNRFPPLIVLLHGPAQLSLFADFVFFVSVDPFFPTRPLCSSSSPHPHRFCWVFKSIYSFFMPTVYTFNHHVTHHIRYAIHSQEFLRRFQAAIL